MIMTSSWPIELTMSNGYFQASTAIFFMVMIVTPPITTVSLLFMQKGPRSFQNDKEMLETCLLPPTAIFFSVYLYKHILELNWMIKETCLSFIYSQAFNQSSKILSKFILFLYNSCESWWVIRIVILVLLFYGFKKTGSEILF